MVLMMCPARSPTRGIRTAARNVPFKIASTRRMNQTSSARRIMVGAGGALQRLPLLRFGHLRARLGVREKPHQSATLAQHQTHARPVKEPAEPRQNVGPMRARGIDF